MSATEELRIFLDALAGETPTPGGGSASAYSGAMGAALVSMVCRLTIGKKKYYSVQDQVQAILEKSEVLRARCTSLVSEDIRAFEQVMAAYRMPKETAAEQDARHAAIQSALKGATLVPMDTAQACAEVVGLSAVVAEIGNVNAASDAGAAAVLAGAGLRGASLNVLINLGDLDDEEFANETKTGLEALIKKQSVVDDVLNTVKARLTKS